MIKVTESQCEIEHHCFQGRAYSHWWMAFSHWVKLPMNDMACLCWQAGDKEVPSGISCHSFSPRKAAESSYLIFFFFSSVEQRSTSFGWIEKFTTTKPSPLIKSAAKPSTTKEHNIWGRWVIPLLNLEAGTEFQMSIITDGDGSEGHTQTCRLTQPRHTCAFTYCTVMKMNLLLTISPLQQGRTKTSFMSECHTESVCERLCAPVLQNQYLQRGRHWNQSDFAVFGDLSFKDDHLIKRSGNLFEFRNYLMRKHIKWKQSEIDPLQPGEINGPLWLHLKVQLYISALSPSFAYSADG